MSEAKLIYFERVNGKSSDRGRGRRLEWMSLCMKTKDIDRLPGRWTSDVRSISARRR